MAPCLANQAFHIGSDFISAFDLMSGHELIFCLEWSKNFTQFEKEMGKLVFFDQISLISKIGIANAKHVRAKIPNMVILCATWAGSRIFFA